MAYAPTWKNAPPPEVDPALVKSVEEDMAILGSKPKVELTSPDLKAAMIEYTALTAELDAMEHVDLVTLSLSGEDLPVMRHYLSQQLGVHRTKYLLAAPRVSVTVSVADAKVIHAIIAAQAPTLKVDESATVESPEYLDLRARTAAAAKLVNALMPTTQAGVEAMLSTPEPQIVPGNVTQPVLVKGAHTVDLAPSAVSLQTHYKKGE